MEAKKLFVRFGCPFKGLFFFMFHIAKHLYVQFIFVLVHLIIVSVLPNQISDFQVLRRAQIH